MFVDDYPWSSYSRPSIRYDLYYVFLLTDMRGYPIIQCHPMASLFWYNTNAEPHNGYPTNRGFGGGDS